MAMRETSLLGQRLQDLLFSLMCSDWISATEQEEEGQGEESATPLGPIPARAATLTSSTRRRRDSGRDGPGEGEGRSSQQAGPRGCGEGTASREAVR